MTKITMNQLPAPLRPEDLAGSESGIGTVEKVLVDVKSPGTRRGVSTVIILKEFPGKGLYLNETSKLHAVQGFESDDSDDWIGKKVPWCVVRSEDPRAAKDPNLPKMVKKVWVAAPEDWPKSVKNSNAKK